MAKKTKSEEKKTQQCPDCGLEVTNGFLGQHQGTKHCQKRQAVLDLQDKGYTHIDSDYAQRVKDEGYDIEKVPIPESMSHHKMEYNAYYVKEEDIEKIKDKYLQGYTDPQGKIVEKLKKKARIEPGLVALTSTHDDADQYTVYKLDNPQPRRTKYLRPGPVKRRKQSGDRINYLYTLDGVKIGKKIVNSNKLNGADPTSLDKAQLTALQV